MAQTSEGKSGPEGRTGGVTSSIVTDESPKARAEMKNQNAIRMSVHCTKRNTRFPRYST